MRPASTGERAVEVDGTHHPGPAGRRPRDRHACPPCRRSPGCARRSRGPTARPPRAGGSPTGWPSSAAGWWPASSPRCTPRSARRSPSSSWPTGCSGATRPSPARPSPRPSSATASTSGSGTKAESVSRLGPTGEVTVELSDGKQRHGRRAARRRRPHPGHQAASASRRSAASSTTPATSRVTDRWRSRGSRGDTALAVCRGRRQRQRPPHAHGQVPGPRRRRPHRCPGGGARARRRHAPRRGRWTLGSPQVVFTDPEVAAAGLTEAEARERGIRIRVVDLPMDSAAGAGLQAEGYQGQARIVVDEDAGVLVGATFVGQDVAELVHAATVAIVGKVPLTTLWHAVPVLPDDERDLAPAAGGVRPLTARTAGKSPSSVPPTRTFRRVASERAPGPPHAGDHLRRDSPCVFRTPLRLGVLTAAAALALLGGGSAASVNAAAVTSPGAAACQPGDRQPPAAPGSRPAPPRAEPELYPKNEANAYGVLKDRPPCPPAASRSPPCSTWSPTTRTRRPRRPAGRRSSRAQMKVLNDSYAGRDRRGTPPTPPSASALAKTTWSVNAAWYHAVPSKQGVEKRDEAGALRG